ncbi:MAG: CHASE3 domain-containing protein [Bacteroidetes bacterium]|nr:CHASE3 domain-containing protein [Bacteroidota bacterium]
MKPLSKSEKKILVSLLSILIILCSLAFFSHRNSNRVLESAAEVDRSQEIKYHIEQLLAVAIDLETGARGYVLTGDENYLEPTNKAIAGIFGHVDHLKEITAGNTVQLNHVLELEKLADQKISNSTRTIEIRRNKGMAEAVSFFSAGDDKLLMDKIRSITGQMLTDEDLALNRKRESNHDFIRNFNLTFDLLLIKIAITIIAIFFVLKYYFKERRKSDEMLREHKDLLQKVIDNTTSVIFIKDLNGRYLMINDQYEKLFHISKEAIKGKTDHEIFTKEIADAIRQADVEVIKTRKAMEFEEGVPNNGEMHHYISVKFPLFDQDEAVYAVCGIATDITERKQSAELLKARSDAIMDLFNNAPSGFHSVNHEGIVIEMNDTELNWLGYSREEIIGKVNVRDLFDLDSRDKFDYHFPRMKEKKTSSIRDLEMNMQRKDGSVISVLVNVSAIFNQAGELVRTRSSVFDMTFRKQVESIISQN